MNDVFFSKFALPNTHEYAPRRSHEFRKIESRDTAARGRHLVAGEPIYAGETVAVDGGEVTSSVEDAPEDKRYAVSYHYGLFLGPSSYENPEKLWFINHSCDSNIARIGGLVFVAKRNIAVNEQLTLDYGPLVTHVPSWRMTCECGSRNCRGVITGTDWMKTEIADRLFSEWLPDIQREIVSRRRV